MAIVEGILVVVVVVTMVDESLVVVVVVVLVVMVSGLVSVVGLSVVAVCIVKPATNKHFIIIDITYFKCERHSELARALNIFDLLQMRTSE